MFALKKSTGMNIFGAIVCQLLAIANLVHALFTWGICAEQIKTGWGYGTNWEMGALLPWFVELLSVPIILAGIVFLAMNLWKRSEKAIFIIGAILLVCEILQIIILNLFLFY